MTALNLLIIAQTTISDKGLPKAQADSPEVQQIIGIMLGIIGAISLLVITLSGLRYILAAGDPQKISKAKNGIIYALVGLVIAIIAEALVAFIAGSL